MIDDATLVAADARLVRLPVDPPRGDAIQKFDALELPIVDLTDRSGRRGMGFGYTIGTGGTAILSLLRDELLDQLIGVNSRKVAQIMERLRKSIHALTPGCVASTALAAIDVALWDLAARRANVPLYILLGGAQDRVRSGDLGDATSTVSRRPLSRAAVRMENRSTASGSNSMPWPAASGGIPYPSRRVSGRVSNGSICGMYSTNTLLGTAAATLMLSSGETWGATGRCAAAAR